MPSPTAAYRRECAFSRKSLDGAGPKASRCNHGMLSCRRPRRQCSREAGIPERLQAGSAAHARVAALGLRLMRAASPRRSGLRSAGARACPVSAPRVFMLEARAALRCAARLRPQGYSEYSRYPEYNPGVPPARVPQYAASCAWAAVCVQGRQRAEYQGVLGGTHRYSQQHMGGAAAAAADRIGSMNRIESDRSALCSAALRRTCV